MTIKIVNDKALPKELVNEELKNNFDDYIADKLKTNLQFEYVEFEGITLMSLNNLIPNQTIFTVITDENEILISQNYKGEAYNIPLLLNHLKEFIQLLMIN